MIDELIEVKDKENLRLKRGVVGGALLLSLAYLLGQEVRQFCHKPRSYFTCKANWVELSYLSFNIFVVCETMLSEPTITVSNLTVVAALASCLMLLNAFNWLRIFDTTGFYIKLLEETIFDILPFILIFVLSLMMFGFTFYMLNFNVVNERTGEEELE